MKTVIQSSVWFLAARAKGKMKKHDRKTQDQDLFVTTQLPSFPNKEFKQMGRGRGCEISDVFVVHLTYL